LRSPPWIARTHLDWAGSLLRRDLVSEAVERLDAARVAIGDLDLVESRRRLAELDELIAAR
jgi:hypothetical protein